MAGPQQYDVLATVLADKVDQKVRHELTRVSAEVATLTALINKQADEQKWRTYTCFFMFVCMLGIVLACCMTQSQVPVTVHVPANTRLYCYYIPEDYSELYKYVDRVNHFWNNTRMYTLDELMSRFV